MHKHVKKMSGMFILQQGLVWIYRRTCFPVSFDPTGDSYDRCREVQTCGRDSKGKL